MNARATSQEVGHCNNCGKWVGDFVRNGLCLSCQIDQDWTRENTPLGRLVGFVRDFRHVHRRPVRGRIILVIMILIGHAFVLTSFASHNWWLLLPYFLLGVGFAEAAAANRHPSRFWKIVLAASWGSFAFGALLLSLRKRHRHRSVLEFLREL